MSIKIGPVEIDDTKTVKTGLNKDERRMLFDWANKDLNNGDRIFTSEDYRRLRDLAIAVCDLLDRAEL